MMLLGDVLAAARHMAGQFHAWLEVADSRLAGAVQSVAAGQGLNPAAYVRMAIADYDRWADQEDWQSLTSRLRNSSDPGAACLSTMVEWRLAISGHAPSGSPLHPPPGEAPETGL